MSLNSLELDLGEFELYLYIFSLDALVQVITIHINWSDNASAWVQLQGWLFYDQSYCWHLSLDKIYVGYVDYKLGTRCMYTTGSAEVVFKNKH